MANQNKIRGITIELSVDATEVTQQIAEVNSKMKTTTSELRDVDKLLKLDPTNTELLKQKTQLLQQEIGQAKEKLEALKQAQKDMDVNGIDKNSEQYQALQREIISTEQELKKLKDTAGSGSSTLAAISQKTGEVGDNMEKAGRAMLPVTAAFTAMGTGAVKVTADFDTAMSQVQATMGLTSDSMSTVNGETVNTMDALRNLAKQMGQSTAFSASECAEALNYLALAGYDAQEMADTLPTVLNLAAAGSLDLGTASDMVTDAMSALGLSTQDAEMMVDQMAKTASSSNTSVGQLGEAMLTIGATGKTMAGGTAELSAALGILANNGIKGAEGGTHLRNVILSLQSPTDQAREIMDQLGISVYDTEGNMRPLNDVLGDLNESMDGMSQEERNDIITKIFNKTDLAAVNSLLDNTGSEWDELQGSITNSAGAAQQMADTQLDNLGGQLTLLKSALEGLAISLGEILMPIISGIVDVVQSVVDWLNSLDDGTKELVVTIAAIVAALGPALIIGGKIMNGISSITGALSKLGTASFGPIGIVIAAVAALAAACAALFEGWKNAYLDSSPFKDALAELKEKNEQLAESISTSMNNYKSETENAEASAAAAERLSGELETLVENYSGTREEQSKIKLLVEELNKLVPDLGLAWDDETESLNMNTQEIHAQIKAMEAQAKVTALSELYTESIKEQYLAKKDLIDAHKTYIGVLERAGITQEEANNYLQKLNDNTWTLGDSFDFMAKHGTDSLGVLEEVSTAFKNDADALNNLTTVTGNVSFAEEQLSIAMTAVSDATEESSNAMRQHFEDLDVGLSDSLNKAITTAQNAGYRIPQSLAEGIQSGQIEENNAIERMNALVQFDTAINTAEISGVRVTNTFIDAWLSGQYDLQTANNYYNSFVNFSNALDNARTQGQEITPTLVNELLDSYGLSKVVTAAEIVGEAAVPQVPQEEVAAEAYETNETLSNELENSSDLAENTASEIAEDVADEFSPMPEKVGEYGSNAGQKLDSGFGENSGNIANTIDSIWNLYYSVLGQILPGKMWEWGYSAGGKLGSGFSESITSITNKLVDIYNTIIDYRYSMEDAGETVGDWMGFGLYQGLRAWQSTIETLAWNMAVSAANEARRALQISSPSKVMEEIGEYTGEGLVVGLGNTADDVKNAMLSLTNSGINALNATARQSQTASAQMQANNQEWGGVMSLLSQYLPYLAEQQNIVLDDGTLAGHMAPAMQEELQMLQVRTARG